MFEQLPKRVGEEVVARKVYFNIAFTSIDVIKADTIRDFMLANFDVTEFVITYQEPIEE